MELFSHFFIVIAMTVLVSVIVMRRYAAAVLRGMVALGPTLLSVPPSRVLDRMVPLTLVDVTAASAAVIDAPVAILKQRQTRRAIVAAYLLSTAVGALILSVVTLRAGDIEITAPRLLALTGTVTGAAVPMIAVSLAWPFGRALLVWIALELGVASLAVIVPAINRLARQGTFDPALVMNAFYVLLWAANTVTVPFAMAFATGLRKLRGAAPMVLALFCVVGLVPLLTARVAGLFAREEDAALRIDAGTVLIYVSFFVLAPAAAWVAWRVLKALTSAYDAKRFSDAQLLATIWWLIFVATLIAWLSRQPGVTAAGLLLAGVTAFGAVPLLNGALLRRLTRHAATGPAPMLLVLRIFGDSARSERLFDRVVARWRLVGPVTVIGAPDILARTVDPVDFLQFVTGRAGQAFVESAAQLDGRLQELDVRPDPDGRHRVTEFWCRENSWQATVTALMTRCNVAVVDVRGLTADRKGVQFELAQLAVRVPADQIVLVVDSKTDRGVIERSVAGAQGTLRLVHVERNSASEMRSVFATLVAATHPAYAR